VPLSIRIWILGTSLYGKAALPHLATQASGSKHHHYPRTGLHHEMHYG
jgi:hypothetical protein